jgi:hypothetical protein
MKITTDAGTEYDIPHELVSMLVDIPSYTDIHYIFDQFDTDVPRLDRVNVWCACDETGTLTSEDVRRNNKEQREMTRTQDAAIVEATIAAKPTCPTTVNGCVVLKSSPSGPLWYVLVHGWNNVTPFVSWLVDADGGAEIGHYFDNIDEALADFNERTGL